MIWRRLPLVLTVLVLGILVSFYLIVSSPRVYEASAVIQIDTPAAVDQGGDSLLPASRRVQLIEQRLMARSNALAIIDRLNLFENATGLSETQKIAALRSSTRIESIAAPGVSADSGMSLAAIVITSKAETAVTAAAIANDFADSVVNRDRENRQARIVEARDYLASEENRLNQELSVQDRELAEFSAKNEDALPTSQEYLQTELAQINESENTLDREVMALQRDNLALEAGPVTAVARGPVSLVQQIRSAEVELAQARRTLPAGHTEITRLEENLKQLNAGGAETTDLITRQSALIDTQMTQLNAQKAAIQGRRKEIENARASSPQVTRDLESMIRQQRRLQDSYAEVSRQLAQVDTQQKLMDNDQAERFLLLERALPPEYAALSNRKKSAALGAFGSFGMAFAIAFILEMMNPVLRRGDQFTRATGTRPVITLPYRRSAADLRRARQRLIYMALLLVFGVIVALWLLGKIPGLPSPGVVATPTDGLG